MVTEVKFQPTKTKVKSKFFDTKAGDKINLDLQGYVKHKDVLSGKPLKGSKVKAKANYKKGEINIDIFSQDLAALDSISNLINLRIDLEVDPFGFSSDKQMDTTVPKGSN